MNFHSDKKNFQVVSTEVRTTDPWITRPVFSPYAMGNSPSIKIFSLLPNQTLMKFFIVFLTILINPLHSHKGVNFDPMMSQITDYGHPERK
jgi:hypothetical protein